MYKYEYGLWSKLVPHIVDRREAGTTFTVVSDYLHWSYDHLNLSNSFSISITYNIQYFRKSPM